MATRATRYVLAACAALVLLPLAVVHGVLRASLPKLDGEAPHSGIVAPVTIERDARGIPTIEAANRVDLAYGTGFVHGQDRFFEMDLSRRLAAGELSEMFGEVALEQDKKARLFRFRTVAHAALEQATAEQRAILEAYARGVNAGLSSLRSRPWEYWVLGSAPQAWRPEDTILVSHAMWWDLQYSAIEREIDRLRINAHLGGASCDSGWKCNLQFLYPATTEWDAPNAAVGVVNAHSDPASPGSGAVDAEAVPPPNILDVRGSTGAGHLSSTGGDSNADPAAAWLGAPERGIGSNNWAVSGRLSATGAALVANDMHLSARVPIVWYRARLRLAPTQGQSAIDLIGVTLPGAPLMVAGSNTHIAWGFTNSYGDWLQVRQIACTGVDDKELHTASGAVPLSVEQEEIRVHGRSSVLFAVRSGPDGVLLQAAPDKHACWFVRWLAQLPAATNMNLMALERATSVEQALAVAPGLGIPHQNFVVGDRDGHIAWTIAGRIPLATGEDRASGASGWTSGERHPRIVDPESGRIWTANARPTDDPGQESTIGGIDASVGAHYDLGARARQIRDDLLALPGGATPADMLRIQLDDRAVFLTRWRDLLVRLLDDDSLTGHAQRAQFRKLVTDWNARASVDSVGYRLVRAYHDRTQEAVWGMIVHALGMPADEQPLVPAQFEPALWRLVTQQPLHMLSADYTSWRQFLLAQVDATLGELQQSCTELAQCTWGSRQPVRIRHPLSRSLPFLSGLLDMPTVQLPGDHEMPRVQDGPIGASERFAVSPGHEAQGYLNMPGGQSGHPLSPYYKSGFMDWAEGTPTAFLPGPAQHKLTLRP